MTGVPFKAGEFIEFREPNAAGYGDPLDRPPDAVREDVLDDFTTIELARDAYGVVFADEAIKILIDLLPRQQAQTLGPGDAFGITLRVSLVIGVILAMPVILYQAWAFIAPGLTPAERKAIRPWVPLALFFFGLGVAIAYIVLPFALQFLFNFNNEQLVENVAAGPYFDFVTTMFLAFGLVMEFPILLYGLARVGILSSAQLAGMRRYVILGIAIFSAVATPGGDLVSPFVLGGTMYLLFEATVFVIRRTGR